MEGVTEPDRVPVAEVVPELASPAARFSCYVLRSEKGGRRYVGMSVDPKRRLRQHNGEIVGGARATRAGRPWRHAAVLSGFACMREALRAEWRLKRLGRGRRGAAGVLAGLRDEVAGRPGGRWTRASVEAYGARRLELRCAEESGGVPGLREAVESVGWGFGALE
jgi:predicted GIY-YIG superfamily endonuclease